MDFKIINVLFLCVVLFTWAPLIGSHDVGSNGDDDSSNTFDVDGTANDADSIANDVDGYDAAVNGYIYCLCGTSMSVMNKTLHAYTAARISDAVVNSISTDENVRLYPDFIDRKDCTFCQVGFYTCNTEITKCIKSMIEFEIPSENQNETDKSNLRAIFKRSSEIGPKTIHIPIGGLKNNTRQVRQIGTCLYPSSMQTSAFACKIYPSSIKCVQQCAFGYTLESGIRGEMQCKFKENKWVPTGFKECKPFIDCSISLISGGSTNCTSMSLDEGPECKIECLHYEDKPAIPESNYVCNIDGKWDPPLPFCVAPLSGMALVKAPKTKLHNDYN